MSGGGEAGTVPGRLEDVPADGGGLGPGGNAPRPAGAPEPRGRRGSLSGMRDAVVSASREHKAAAVLLFVMAIVMIVALATGASDHDAAAGSDSGAAGPPAGAASKVSFQVIGDWGRRGSPEQQATAAAMVSARDTYGSQFVISTGDNFYSYGVIGAADPQFRASWEDVYAGLNLKWYSVMGNHDYRGVLDAQIRYTHPLWVMPALNYTHTVTSGGSCFSRFVFIDTSPFIQRYYTSNEGNMSANVQSQNTAAQRQWIESTVMQSAVECRWVFVVGHHPLYSAGEHGDNTELNFLVPLFQAFPSKIVGYISGHDHDVQHIRMNWFNQWVSGAGSSIRSGVTNAHNPLYRAAQNAVMNVEATNDQVVLKFLSASPVAGELYSYTFT